MVQGFGLLWFWNVFHLVEYIFDNLLDASELVVALATREDSGEEIDLFLFFLGQLMSVGETTFGVVGCVGACSTS